MLWENTINVFADMKLKVYICMKYRIFNVLQSDAATDVNRYAALFFTYFPPFFLRPPFFLVLPQAIYNTSFPA